MNINNPMKEFMENTTKLKQALQDFKTAEEIREKRIIQLETKIIQLEIRCNRLEEQLGICLCGEFPDVERI